MSTASNRFYVETIEDGITLRGELLSTKPLSQAWGNGAAIPSWEAESGAYPNSPVIYLNLRSGATSVTADSGGRWLYNNGEISFSETQTTKTINSVQYQGYESTSHSGLFFKTTKDGNPALAILGNLASSDNRNTDSITYIGSYTISGSTLDFSATALVMITSVTGNGIFGVIEFIGANIITEKNQKIYAHPILYNADNEKIPATATGNPFRTSWKLNGSTYGSPSTVTIGGVTYYNVVTIDESDVTEYCTIECTFTYEATTYTAYNYLNDDYDEEQLYIQYEGSNNNSATLKKGGSVEWHLWMGTRTDPTVDTSWKKFYVKLLKADGSVVLSSLSSYNINNVESSDTSNPYYGFRKVPWQAAGYASITIGYEMVHTMFDKYLTAIVLAEEGQFSS